MGALVPASRREAIRRKLLAWWDAGHRDLPWRFPQHQADPYRVWVAEVMLQQTQAAAVVPFYRRFLERFPTLASLAKAREEEVLELWSGLGYYARGRRLHAAAREALARHGGLPGSFDALLALPGFGPYTAGAVASIAFALPVPCVDGNAVRVLSRLFLVEGAPEEPATRRRLWALAAELVPRRRPGDFNQSVMELGATVCGKPRPRCERCPMASLCRARRAGREQEVPPARRRAAPKELHLACAVVRRGEALLMTRRPQGGLFGGLWGLPSAVVAPGEDSRAVLRRELTASLGLRAVPGARVASVERALTHRRLHLTAYLCRAASLPAALKLFGARERVSLAMAIAMRRLLAAAEATLWTSEAPARGRSRGRTVAADGRRAKPLLTRGGPPV